MSAPAATTSEQRRRGMIVPLIIGIALFMQNLDSTIIANALPRMAEALHESPLALNLAITSYLLAAAIFLPISGWAADRFGARLVFLIAIIGFAASSLFCGLAETLPELVSARFLQGCAGAMMVPVGRLVVLRTVPKSDLVKAMSYLTIPAILGPVLGPPLGGFIVTYSSWRLIFLLNIPIAALGVAMVSLFVPNVREETRTPLDLRGFVLAGAGLAGIVFGFENLGRGILPPDLVFVLLALGVFGLTGFAFHAKRTAHPILELPLFKIQTFLAATFGGIFPRLIIGANQFLMALLLQLGFGMNAFHAGLMTLSGAFGALMMRTAAPAIIKRFGFKRVLVTVAMASAALFMSYALFTPETPKLVIILTMFVSGFFASLHFTSLNTLAYADVPQSAMSKASTLASMGQQISISLGVGISAIVIETLQEMYGTVHLTPVEISPAFIVIGALALVSLFFYLPLPARAGAEVSGHKGRLREAD